MSTAVNANVQCQHQLISHAFVFALFPFIYLRYSRDDKSRGADTDVQVFYNARYPMLVVALNAMTQPKQKLWKCGEQKVHCRTMRLLRALSVRAFPYDNFIYLRSAFVLHSILRIKCIVWCDFVSLVAMRAEKTLCAAIPRETHTQHIYPFYSRVVGWTPFLRRVYRICHAQTIFMHERVHSI